MERRPDLRVSDRDRQAAAQRLLAAHNEGRLDLAEYDTRVSRAYAAVTYADLDDLFADLPGSAPGTHPFPVPVAERAVPAAPAITAGLPQPLKILWTVWLTGTLVSLVVWLLVSFAARDMQYFWPIWLTVPGVALFGVTIGASGTSGVDDRQAARARMRQQRRLAHDRRRAARRRRR